jgi:hypothetical protein
MGEMIPIAAIVVGGVLLFPLVVGFTLRRLKPMGGAHPSGRDHEIARLEAELQHTRDELQRLSERQQFVEALLEKRSEPTSLPR